jgi:hypothetical protein
MHLHFKCHGALTWMNSSMFFSGEILQLSKKKKGLNEFDH